MALDPLPLGRSQTPLTPALEHAVRVAVAQYPDESVRIERGYAIARQGHVRLSGSGLAEVQSQHHPATWYMVNGCCRCPNSRYVPEGRCKHWWAKRLLVWAQTCLAQTTDLRIPDAPATAYAFPRWTRYAATYQGPHTAMQPVNGIAALLEPGWFVFQPAAGGDGWECAYHEVALGPGLAEGSDTLALPGFGEAVPIGGEMDRLDLLGRLDGPGDVAAVWCNVHMLKQWRAHVEHAASDGETEKSDGGACRLRAVPADPPGRVSRCPRPGPAGGKHCRLAPDACAADCLYQSAATGGHRLLPAHYAWEGLEALALQCRVGKVFASLHSPGTLSKEEESWEMRGRPAGVFCYVCALYTKRDAFVGEGRGAREVARDKDVQRRSRWRRHPPRLTRSRVPGRCQLLRQDLADQQAPETTVRQQKRQIVVLLKPWELGTTDTAGDEEAVRRYTALALIPDYSPELMRRLKGCIQEQGDLQAGW